MIALHKKFAVGLLASGMFAAAASAALAQQQVYQAGVQAIYAPDSRPCATLILLGVSVGFALPVASPYFEERYSAVLTAGALRQQGAIAVVFTSGVTAPLCSNLLVPDSLAIVFP